MIDIQLELKSFLDLSPSIKVSRRIILEEIKTRRKLIFKYESEIKDLKSMIVSLFD